MKKLLSYYLILPLFCIQTLTAQELHPAIVSTVQEISDFVAIPNDAMNMEDMKDNLIWLKKAFVRRGFSIMEIPTSNVPLFFASGKIRDDRPTVLFYMHFDGQAVDRSKWDQDDPYRVVIKEKNGDQWKVVDQPDLEAQLNPDWRLFGRSVSDDKGPIVMFLNAWDHFVAQGKTPAFNIKVILDGEEEQSSKPLPGAVKEFRELFEADVLIINDGPVHPSGQPTLVYGCRGITTLTLTTYGPEKPQHSGHFGNYAPNPAFTMATLLNSLKDEKGVVKVPGYYDGIEITPEIKNLLSEVPEDEAKLKERLQIATTDQVGSTYQESLQYPSLNVRGLSSGWTGDATRTIVPDRATAEIDLRLVPETPGKRQKELIRTYLEKQGYHLTDEEPDPSTRMAHEKIVLFEEGSVVEAFRSPMDGKEGIWLQTTLKNAFDQNPVNIRIMGGTVPISPFINTLNIPAFIVPMVNPDNNQHSPNENLSLERINYGLQVYEALFSSVLTGI